jgi:hypothetical protein
MYRYIYVYHSLSLHCSISLACRASLFHSLCFSPSVSLAPSPSLLNLFLSRTHLLTFKHLQTIHLSISLMLLAVAPLSRCLSDRTPSHPSSHPPTPLLPSLFLITKLRALTHISIHMRAHTCSLPGCLFPTPGTRLIL